MSLHRRVFLAFRGRGGGGNEDKTWQPIPDQDLQRWGVWTWANLTICRELRFWDGGFVYDLMWLRRATGVCMASRR